MLTPQVRSISERLKRIATDHQATYGEILTQFLIERAVARLVLEPELMNHLVFKGGFVGLRVYGSPRFTTDLDAITYRKDRTEIIELIRLALSKSLGDHVWFTYERNIDLVTQGEYGGIRLAYRFGLGEPPKELKRSQIFHIDIGSGDPVTPGPRIESTTPILGEEKLTWLVYPVETIIAEKLHPLVKLGPDNSRSKDIFDLAHFLPKASVDLLKMAIEATFDYRGGPVPVSFAEFLRSFDRQKLRRGWKSATGTILAAPDFDRCFDEIISWMDTHSV
jgi:hypothetical protein